MGAASCEAYEARVAEVERGVPLPLLTLDGSTTQLEALIRGEDWRTPQERDQAQRLVIRLARLRWSIQDRARRRGDEPAA